MANAKNANMLIRRLLQWVYPFFFQKIKLMIPRNNPIIKPNNKRFIPLIGTV
jgi:hypothetical protein